MKKKGILKATGVAVALCTILSSMSFAFPAASAAILENSEVSATQATGLKVTSESNYFPTATVSVEKGETFSVDYIIDSSMDLVNTQWTLTYDSSKLAVNETASSDFMPEITNEFSNHMSDKATVKGNFSDISDLADFNGGKTLVQVYFDAIGTGEANLNLDLEVLSVGYLDEDFVVKYQPAVRRSKAQNITTISGFESVEVKADTKITKNSSDTTTVYFAAPRVAPGRTVWSDVDIYYNDTTSVIKANRIHMTDTGLVVDNPNGSKLKTTRRGNWHVFSAELSADQVAAIDAAKYAGFVYSGNYNLKTSAKFDIKMGGSIADFDGQVFLIDSAITKSEVDSYTGAWTTAEMFAPKYEATTLKFACPTTNWSGGVYFYYGDSSVITTVNKLAMTATDKTLTVSASLVEDLTKYQGGEWTVYTLDLTAEQVEIIDNSSVSGFCSGDSIYVKTSSSRNVFRDYNSVQDVANYAFVATGCIKPDQEKTSLTGKWRWCKL